MLDSVWDDTPRQQSYERDAVADVVHHDPQVNATRCEATVAARDSTYSDPRTTYVTSVLVSLGSSKRIATGIIEILVKP
jgi:hypothetical protein